MGRTGDLAVLPSLFAPYDGALEWSVIGDCHYFVCGVLTLSLKLDLYRLIHSVTKSLDEHKDKLDDAVKAEINTALDEAKALSGTAETDAVKAVSSKLSNAALKIGQSMYGKGQSGGGDAGAKEGEGASDPSAGASEAEFKEKKEESK